MSCVRVPIEFSKSGEDNCWNCRTGKIIGICCRLHLQTVFSNFEQTLTDLRVKLCESDRISGLRGHT
jgi:hypothetical protein